MKISKLIMVSPLAIGESVKTLISAARKFKIEEISGKQRISVGTAYNIFSGEKPEKKASPYF